MSADSFPRQHARTRRFTLGEPRNVTVTPDGSRVDFLRSPTGDDPRTGLWVLDLPGGGERLVADPVGLVDGDAEDLPDAERTRRERARETSTGVVSYATDRAGLVAAFALSGRLFLADLVAGTSRELPAVGAVVDPRPDPTGRWVAYVAAGALHLVSREGRPLVALTDPEGPDVTWGLAEFVAAEEMGRRRGYWWAPDGSRLLVTRVDERAVRRCWVADPARPDCEPTLLRYPLAGTANAEVSLHVLSLEGRRVRVDWEVSECPYLAAVSWPEFGAPLLVVQSRDQRAVRVLELDPDTGVTSLLREDTDPHWVDLVEGVPGRLGDGRWVGVAVGDGARGLVVADTVVTPPEVQVRAVVAVGDREVLFTAGRDDPTEISLWRWSDYRLDPVSSEPGVHTGTAGGGVTVVASAGMDHDGTRVSVSSGFVRHQIASYAETPCLQPWVRFLTLGERGLRAGLLLPRDHQAGRRLPVLLDPYGGPGAQRVLAERRGWLVSQWLADQGFAVLVIDGRGTPGRGPVWERALAGDLAGPVLDDQVAGLLAAGQHEPDLDLSRVAIRGWSFGGYLAALAVLRRPDVFAAAVAGAPVTDWRLYDTHYAERYLGHPDEQPEAYARSSLLADAARLRRPLLLIHGLADDNVLVAHSLRLSQRLTEAGRSHTVLPLSGVTHLTPQPQVAENLLLLQVDFLLRALG